MVALFSKFAFFYFFILCSALEIIEESLEPNDYILIDTKNFPTPVYFAQELPLPNAETMKLASFCMLEQPKFDLKYFEKVFDQTDSNLFKEEDQLLMVDEQLYVMLSTGIFQVFNISFEENSGSSVFFSHYNEIKIVDDHLFKAMNGPYYIKLLYNLEYHKVLIVLQEEVIIINIDFQKKQNWMKYTKIPLDNPNDPINRAILVDNYLYILRKNSYLEKYHMFNESYLALKATVHFSELTFLSSFNVDLQNQNITDFFIDEKYIAFLEKQSLNVFLFRINGNIEDMNKFNLHNISLEYDPLKVEIANSKLFVLVDGQSKIEYFLNEYLILENSGLDYSDTYHIDYGYSDIHIANNYLFYSYQDYTTMFPHAFMYPNDLNRRLKITINVENVREIESFKMSNDALNRNIQSRSNYYTAAIGDHIGVLKADLLPGNLVCKTDKTPEGDYYRNFRFFSVNCQNFEKNCNSSNYYTTDKLIKIHVIPAIDRGAEAGLDKKEGLVIGLIFGLGFSCLILVFCLLYVRKIKKSYVLYEDNRDRVHMRVMSKEELNDIEVHKNMEEK